MGEGMAYNGLPFPDTGYPVPGVYIYFVYNSLRPCDAYMRR